MHKFQIVSLDNQHLYLTSWGTQHLRVGIPIPELKADVVQNIDLVTGKEYITDLNEWTFDRKHNIYKSYFGSRIIMGNNKRRSMTQCPDCKYHKRKLDGKYPLMKMKDKNIGKLKCPHCGYTCLIRLQDVKKNEKSI